MPCEFIALMGACAPLFSKPVCQHVQVLLMGALLSPGKRTVTAAWRVMGVSQDAQFQHDHRVLNRALWSGLTTSQVLLGLLVSAFASTGTCWDWTTLSSGDGARSSPRKASIVIRYALLMRTSAKPAACAGFA